MPRSPSPQSPMGHSPARGRSPPPASRSNDRNDRHEDRNDRNDRNDRHNRNDRHDRGGGRDDRPFNKKPIYNKDENQISIYVGNLPAHIREAELQKMFEKYGELKDVYMPRNYFNGEPKCFAYIEFAKRDEADEAIKAMDGQDVDNKRITVTMARGKRKTPIEMRVKSGGGSGGRRGRRSRSPPRRRRHSPYGYRGGGRRRSYSPGSRSPVSPRRSYSPSPRRDNKRRRRSPSPRSPSPGYRRSYRDNSPRRRRRSPSPKRGRGASPVRRRPSSKSPRRSPSKGSPRYHSPARSPGNRNNSPRGASPVRNNDRPSNDLQEPRD